VVFDLPRMYDVITRKDIPCQDIEGSTLKMNIYNPPDFDFQTKVPAIIIVWGFSYIADHALNVVGIWGRMLMVKLSGNNHNN
jgi:hypothetical protein